MNYIAFLAMLLWYRLLYSYHTTNSYLAQQRRDWGAMQASSRAAYNAQRQGQVLRLNRIYGALR